MLELREYQRRSLDVLDDYLRRANTLGANTAFYDITRRSYQEINQLPALPLCMSSRPYRRRKDAHGMSLAWNRVPILS
jgi:hypothetical protein